MKYLVVLLMLMGCSKEPSYKLYHCYEFFFKGEFYTFKVINIKQNIYQTNVWASGYHNSPVKGNFTQLELNYTSPLEVDCPGE